MNTLLEQLQSAFAQLLAEPRSEASSGPETAAETAGAPAEAAAARCQTAEFKTKGYHLDVTVRPDQLVAAARLLDAYGFTIDTVTGVDWMAAGEMEAAYDFFHFSAQLHVVLRTRAARVNPEVPTISHVFPGANWHERETHEFFGIRFIGHPNLAPLLLPEDATYHPLRKDFVCAG
jgi:NADH-quinone oxidoreductase subunit C